MHISNQIFASWWQWCQDSCYSVRFWILSGIPVPGMVCHCITRSISTPTLEFVCAILCRRMDINMQSPWFRLEDHSHRLHVDDSQSTIEHSKRSNVCVFLPESSKVMWKWYICQLGHHLTASLTSNLPLFHCIPPQQPYKIGGNIIHTHRIVQELKWTFHGAIIASSSSSPDWS